MKCPKCQFENPDGAKFCNECGHELDSKPKAPLKILSFEDKLEKFQRYLPKGLTEKILNQKDKIEGERKQVSVMFCDMEGFSIMVEKLGSEEAYYVMDQVYEILIHTVHKFEGIVNEMTGDGIMALFGAPISIEDAAQKALWSALAIHREMAVLSLKKSDVGPIRMRIGVHTGSVIVGTLGNDLRVEFKAVGNTVNLASRMEKLAGAGATFVTEETFKLTEGLFRFEALGKKSVKGQGNPISVYKLLSAKEDVYRHRLGSERMIYSEMVGRNKELDRLELQVMKAVNGEGSVVNIIGEAGIGKSRLIAELKKREVMKRVTLLEGGAISIGRNLSFHPIIDLLKQWARIRADDGEAMAFGKLEAAVRNLYPEDAGEVLPFVAALMGMKPSGRYAERIKGIEGEALEKMILKNVRELLIKATELKPLVIILEDLHWADTSSLDLLESLFRLTETRNILFINVFRPGYEKTGNRLIDTIKKKLSVYYVEIVLEPLDDQMSEVLIMSMLKISGLHHAIIGKIVQRTGGNPFFIEEVLRSFLDEGALIQKSGTFQVTEQINTITIPYTIHDVLMARFDRLDEQTRSLVKIAAVIGRNFFHRILAEVATEIKDMDRKLSYLKNVELFRERKRMGEVEYIFKHALAQEVAYESILPQKCRELHLKVARSIEKVFADRLYEFYGMLAYHYSKAENVAKAEEYLIQAGEEALKSSASNEALYYYQEVLHLYLNRNAGYTDPEKLAMMEKNIALALYYRGLHAESLEHFNKALDYYWGKLPKNKVSSILKFLSASCHLLITMYLSPLKFKNTPTPKDFEVINLFHKKCKALGTIDPKRFFFEFLYLYKSVTVFNLKNFDLGLMIYMDASAIFSFSGVLFKLSRRILDSVKIKISKDNAKILMNYDFLETIHNYFHGNWKEISAYDKDLVKRNLKIGEIWDTSQYLFWHCAPKIYQGAFDTAGSIMQELDEIINVYENDFSLLLKYELNIFLLIEFRKLDEALNEIDKAVNIVESAGFNMYLFDMYSYRVWIYTLKGDMEAAENCLDRANKIRPEINAIPIILSTFYRSQLEFWLHRLNASINIGDKSEISKYRQKVVQSSRVLVSISKRAAIHRTESYKLAGLYFWLMKKQKKALQWWRKAIREGEHLEARLELSRVYFEVGKRLCEPGSRYKELDGISAEEYLEKAKVLFTEMNLQWDIAEFNRLRV